MSDSLSLNDLTRAPAAKFEQMGDKIAGKIVAVRRTQQRDFDTGTPMSFPSGDPRMQTELVLQTAEGEFTVYARGGRFEVGSGEGQSMESAIVSAVRAAGGTSIDTGAELAIVHSGLGKRDGAKQPAKLYVAQYKPKPEGSVNVDDLFAQ